MKPHTDYAWEVAKQLRDRGIHVEVDERNEKMHTRFVRLKHKKNPLPIDCW